MKNLNKQLDQDRKVLTAAELDAIDGAADIGDKIDANEDLYYVLFEKTEGEAALWVNSCEPGEGIDEEVRRRTSADTDDGVMLQPSFNGFQGGFGPSETSTSSLVGGH